MRHLGGSVQPLIINGAGQAVANDYSCMATDEISYPPLAVCECRNSCSVVLEIPRATHTLSPPALSGAISSSLHHKEGFTYPPTTVAVYLSLTKCSVLDRLTSHCALIAQML